MKQQQKTWKNADSKKNDGSKFSQSSKPAGNRFGGNGGGRPQSGGGARGGSFGGGRGQKPAAKKGFRGQYIEERMFINRATVQDEVKYVPKHTFSDFNVHKSLLGNLARKNYVNPTPIQDMSIPVTMMGGDVIGLAATGTGKTAAFLIPIIDALLNKKRKGGIVLAPTRELALQIHKEWMEFTMGMKLWSVVCVGGMPIYPQMDKLKRGVNLIIGTPGRVQDLIDRNCINLMDYDIAVLDEADRMLDMGFVHDMKSILGGMPVEKQGLFFSATMTPAIEKLCSEFLNNPHKIKIAARETSANVEQDVIRINGQEKIDLLHDLLNQKHVTKSIIFRQMKYACDKLQKELHDRGIKAGALHGDMRTRERNRTLEAFTKGEISHLIATDVAARGIDVPDVSHVINYDIPETYETYIHRIGRTGRGSKTGNALTFV